METADNGASGTQGVSGYGEGDTGTVFSVDEVARQAEGLAEAGPTREEIEDLATGPPVLRVRGLRAGYGPMEIIHGIDLAVGPAQSLCLIGPNGAGKSTVLHAIFGLADVYEGEIKAREADITRIPPNRKLAQARIAYVLQDNSVFPDMTVWENLLMGGFLMESTADAEAGATAILNQYDRLRQRQDHAARVLSGGERRLLEIARALMLDPDILLIDEPSIGLEPRYIDMVFEILVDLQRVQKKAIVMVEQNARKGLDFSDIGYVLVAGRVAKAGPGNALLADPDIGRLFLGG